VTVFSENESYKNQPICCTSKTHQIQSKFINSFSQQANASGLLKAMTSRKVLRLDLFYRTTKKFPQKYKPQTCSTHWWTT